MYKKLHSKCILIVFLSYIVGTKVYSKMNFTGTKCKIYCSIGKYKQLKCTLLCQKVNTNP